jgi:hypothetical protein
MDILTASQRPERRFPLAGPPLLVGALAGLTLLLWGRGAAAVDVRTYVGSLCVPADGHDTGRVGNTYPDNQAQILSAPSGTLDVVCPIVKGVKSDTKLESVALNLNLATSGTVSCNLWAAKSDAAKDTTVNKVAVLTGTATGAGARTINFGAFAANQGAAWPATGTTFVFYQIRCSLRASDRVVSYKVTETGNPTESARIYPPSMCRLKHDGNESKYFITDPSDTAAGGYVQARVDGIDTGSEFNMLCPIVADHTLGGGGTKSAIISVGRPDVAGYRITCALYETTDWGMPIDSTSSYYLGAAAGGGYPTQALNLKLAGNTGGNWVKYHINCLAPGTADSRIFGYRIEEN